MIQDAIDLLVKLVNDNPDKLDNIMVIKKGLIIVRIEGHDRVFTTAVQLLEFLEQ